MAKETKESKKVSGELGKRVAIVFYENEMPKIAVGLKIDKDSRPREISNAIRKFAGVPEVQTVRSSKRRELKLALGLPEDATQTEINEAMMKKLQE